MANTSKKKKVKDAKIVEEPVSEEIVKTEEKVEEVKEEVIEQPVEEKKEPVKMKPDNKKFMSEMKSFFTILFIIGLLILGGWYWYKHSDVGKNKDEEENNNGSSKYVYKEYKETEELGTPKLYYGKYIAYNNKGLFTKIVTLDGKDIISEAVDADEFFLDTNGNICFVDYDDNDNLTLYLYEDNELKKEFSMIDDDTRVNFILYYDRETWDEYLLGLFSYDDNFKTVSIYSLDGDSHDFEGYYMLGDTARLDYEENVITYNKKYVSFSDEENVGLYDLENYEVAIEPKYNGIYSAGKNFVVEKDDKSGLISSKQKILLPIEYDFIDYVDEEYFVVAKDNKMAIMNSDLVLVTDYSFDFQGEQFFYKLCCGEENDYFSIKSGDRYMLVTNANIYNKYEKNEAYLINKDGTYTTVEEYEVQEVDGYYLFLNKDKKTYDVYNKDFEKQYTINLKSYDFSSDDVWFGRIGDILLIEDNNIYFDIKTGEELESAELVNEFDNVKLVYNKDDVDVFVDGKNAGKIEFSKYYRNLTFNKFNKGFYISTASGIHVFVEK